MNEQLKRERDELRAKPNEYLAMLEWLAKQRDVFRLNSPPYFATVLSITIRSDSANFLDSIRQEMRKAK